MIETSSILSSFTSTTTYQLVSIDDCHSFIVKGCELTKPPPSLKLHDVFMLMSFPLTSSRFVPLALSLIVWPIITLSIVFHNPHTR